MLSVTFIKNILCVLLISVLSGILIIPSFGCDCDGPDLDTLEWKLLTYLSMSDAERAALMAKHETPKPIATPETRVKKDITDKGQAGEAGDAGEAPGGC